MKWCHPARSLIEVTTPPSPTVSSVMSARRQLPSGAGV
jgi:hypothetical protein